MIITSAPGKIILFGEHAVVYDKLSIATAIDKKVRVTVNPGEEDVKIISRNFNLEKKLSGKKLFELLEKFNYLKQKKDFHKIKEMGDKDLLSPVFIVIASILRKYGFQKVNPVRKNRTLDQTRLFKKGPGFSNEVNILIESEIPKNLGSSSAVFAAIALGISKFLGKDLSKKEISDLAFQGDIIAHGGTPSGIDNNIVTYGGFVKYRKSEGITSLDVDFNLPLIIVDSGEPARTGETVSYIRKQREENPKFVNSVLNSLDDITKRALESLNSKNSKDLGKLMFDYYQELKKLNISTPELDKIIGIARQNRTLGAKPTGGWGGGCCLVLAKNQKEILNLMRIFKEKGFKSFQSKIGVEGVKLAHEIKNLIPF